MAMGAGQHKAYKLDVVTKARVAWDSVDIGPSWPGTELDDWAGLIWGPSWPRTDYFDPAAKSKCQILMAVVKYMYCYKEI